MSRIFNFPPNSLVTTSSFSDSSDSSRIQICTVDGNAHLFHYDVDQKRLNTYFFDSLHLEHHQIFEADGVKVIIVKKNQVEVIIF